MFDHIDPSGWAKVLNWLTQSAIAIGASILIALIVHWIIYMMARRVARLSRSIFDEAVLGSIKVPLRWTMIGLALAMAAWTDALAGEGWDTAAAFITPALLGWVAYKVVSGLVAGFEMRFEAAHDPIGQRARRTRISILARTAKVAIVIISVSLIMLNIPGVRDVGVTLIASAGLAALAVGAAAQPALKSLIAGMQMALTQPLRIGDLVKVDGETGRVEEIRMSFVTVRLWDERVLVVPTTRFFETSFENWSRVDEKLTGPVFLHLDPASEIPPIRTEFERFVSAHPLWDGRNLELLITEAFPESVELRLSMSAETIGNLWTLRCETREHMLAWLREEMPEALIRHRLEVEAANARVKQSGS